MHFIFLWLSSPGTTDLVRSGLLTAGILDFCFACCELSKRRTCSFSIICRPHEMKA